MLLLIIFYLFFLNYILLRSSYNHHKVIIAQKEKNNTISLTEIVLLTFGKISYHQLRHYKESNIVGHLVVYKVSEIKGLSTLQVLLYFINSY